MLVDQVPDPVRAQLVPIARVLADTERDHDLLRSRVDEAPGAAAHLLAVLTPDGPGDERLGRLLRGDSSDRQEAARCAARRSDPESDGLLIALAADADPRVRGQATAALAARVGTSSLSDRAAQVVEASLDDPGVRVPMDVALALKEAETEDAPLLLERLRDHPSAYLRAFACRTASA